MSGNAHDVRKTGLGAALERARRFHGLTLEDAARSTKLRAAHLAALEAEDFSALDSELMVRSSLQTYARYLGVDPDRVLEAYRRRAEPVADDGAPDGLLRASEVTPVRARDDQRLIIVAAVAVVLVLLVFGLVSRGRSDSGSAPIPTETLPPDVPARAAVSIEALRPVEVEVTIDGVPETHAMAAGETLSFEAAETLRISVPAGDAIHVWANDEDLGVPDETGQPWEQTFLAEVAEATPEARVSGTPAEGDGATPIEGTGIEPTVSPGEATTP